MLHTIFPVLTRSIHRPLQHLQHAPGDQKNCPQINRKEGDKAIRPYLFRHHMGSVMQEKGGITTVQGNWDVGI